MTRMLTRLVPVAATILVAGAGGCERVHGCTLIACRDQASLILQRADGMPPGLAVSLDLDGRQVECPPPQAGTSTVCDTDVSIASREMVSCTEERTKDAVGLKCVPTGKFEEIVTVTATPAVIHASARLADTVVAERTFDPQYRTVQPNGPDCEPTCRQWSEVWPMP
jgi:hypothetical protein